MGYDWGMGSGGWLWMIGGLVLLIGIVVLAVREMGGFNRADRRADTSPRPDPSNILRARSPAARSPRPNSSRRSEPSGTTDELTK